MTEVQRLIFLHHQVGLALGVEDFTHRPGQKEPVLHAAHEHKELARRARALVTAYERDGNGVSVAACEDALIAAVKSLGQAPRAGEPDPEPDPLYASVARIIRAIASWTPQSRATLLKVLLERYPESAL